MASVLAAENNNRCRIPCPENSACIDKHCRCNQGYIGQFSDPNNINLQNCDDINECAPPNMVSCGKLADCKNTEGSYYCECSEGYKLATGGKKFNNESENSCQDVNECLAQPPICHNSTVCVNSHGSYSCHCPLGWLPKAGYRDKQKDTICEEISFPDWDPPAGIRSQSLSRFFKRVGELSRNFKSDKAKDTIKDLITSIDELLEGPGDLGDLTPSEQHQTATNLLSGLEVVLRTLAKAIPEKSLTYVSPSNTELSVIIKDTKEDNATLGQSHTRVMLNWAVAGREDDFGPVLAGVFSSRSMGKLVASASLELDPESQLHLERLHQSPVRGARLQLLSAVSSVFLSNPHTEHLAHPVYLAFAHPVSLPPWGGGI